MRQEAINVQAGDWGLHISTGSTLGDVVVFLVFLFAAYGFGVYVVLPGIKAWRSGHQKNPENEQPVKRKARKASRKVNEQPHE